MVAAHGEEQLLADRGQRPVADRELELRAGLAVDQRDAVPHGAQRAAEHVLPAHEAGDVGAGRGR